MDEFKQKLEETLNGLYKKNQLSIDAYSELMEFADPNQALQLQQTGVSNLLLAEKIILSLDDYGRKVHPVEYGLPIDPGTKDFEDKRPQEMLKIVIDILNGC